MEDYPVESLSIQMRERIVLPLATIQQYAIIKMHDSEQTPQGQENIFRKLATRCSFGIINAARNSA
jgi:phosphoenolpyruvate carboxylase